MFFTSIQFLPIISAAVISFALGFLWYSPVLFGKAWMKETGVESSSENKKSKLPMLIPLFSSIVSAYIIGALFNSLIIVSLFQVMVLSLSMWAGFALPVFLNNVIFGNKTWKLFGIDAGYSLASILISAIVIFWW